MTGGLSWLKNTLSSCEREVVPRACDVFLKEASLTCSYKLTAFSEEELADGNDPAQVPGLFQDSDPDEENAAFWEGCRAASVNEHLSAQGLAGGGHHELDAVSINMMQVMKYETVVYSIAH